MFVSIFSKFNRVEPTGGATVVVVNDGCSKPSPFTNLELIEQIERLIDERVNFIRFDNPLMQKEIL